MKPKKIGKRFTLKKETVAHLSNKQQDRVKGGVTYTVFPCVISKYCETLHFTNCEVCPTVTGACATCETCQTCQTCETCYGYTCEDPLVCPTVNTI